MDGFGDGRAQQRETRAAYSIVKATMQITSAVCIHPRSSESALTLSIVSSTNPADETKIITMIIAAMDWAVSFVSGDVGLAFLRMLRMTRIFRVLKIGAHASSIIF
eukprot:SAG31_NODE_7449_length_1686_cov_1.666667_4_plen_106_part_00